MGIDLAPLACLGKGEGPTWMCCLLACSTYCHSAQLRLPAHVMHSLPMLQCAVPNSVIGKRIMTFCTLTWLFVCRVCQTFMTDNAELLRAGLCNKLDGPEIAVT